MPFTIEGETADGEYFVVDDIESYDDLVEWRDFLDAEYDIVDMEWDYTGE